MSYEPHTDDHSKKLPKRLGLLKHITPYLKQRQRELDVLYMRDLTYFNVWQRGMGQLW